MSRRRVIVAALLVAAALLAPPPGLGMLWRVYGPSMEPTITDGSLVIVDTIDLPATGYRRGDIVILTPPGHGNEFPFETMIKRVVAVPGEHVRIDHGVVVVNGRLLDEPYLPSGQAAAATVADRDGKPDLELTVPADSVLVLGDHRSVSFDSTAFGPVPVDQLHGRVMFILGAGGIVVPRPSPVPGVASAHH